MNTAALVASATTVTGTFIIVFHSVAVLLLIVLPPAIVFVSSLIVGLTDYPRTKSFLDVLLRVLNFLSVLVHRNSPHTFKPPFVQSEPPTVASSLPARSPPTGPPVIAPLMFVALFFGLSSCAHVPLVATQAIDCTESAIQQNLPGLVKVGENILTSGSPDWQSAADTAETAGGDAFICAIESIVSDLTHSDGTLAPAQEIELQRAQQWLGTQPKVARLGSRAK